MGLSSKVTNFLRGFAREAKAAFSGARRERLISIVLLMRKPCEITEADFRILFSAALGVQLGNKPTDPSIFVQFKPTMFGIQTRGQRYGMIVAPMRYTKDRPLNFDHLTVSVREAHEQHQAWVAVDAMGVTSETRLDHVYSTIGKLLAEVIEADPANVLAAFATETGRIVCMHPELAENLRGKKPFASLGFPNPPVIKVRSGDAEMQAAAAEARRRWPEFVAAFNARTLDQIFSVKVGISSGLHREFIWVSPTAIEGNQIQGTLDNEPAKLRGLKIDDAVTASLDDLNDWLIKTSSGITGGFTVKVLLERKRR